MGLSFAGRQDSDHPSMNAIAAAQVGNPVTLDQTGERWLIRDEQGRGVVNLSRAFAPPDNAVFLRAEVAAVMEWRKGDSEENYHHQLRRDAWEVVLPELLFRRQPKRTARTTALWAATPALFRQKPDKQRLPPGLHRIILRQRLKGELKGQNPFPRYSSLIGQVSK